MDSSNNSSYKATPQTGTTCLSDDEYSNTSSVGSNQETTTTVRKTHIRLESGDSYNFNNSNSSKSNNNDKNKNHTETTHVMLARLWWIRFLLWSESNVRSHVFFEYQDPISAFVLMAKDGQGWMRKKKRGQREQQYNHGYVQV